jgi:hypothetical protein
MIRNDYEREGPEGGGKPPADKGDHKLPDWKTKKTKGVITRMGAKTKKTTTYYWCPHHGYYTAHKPSDCKAQGTNSKPAAEANAAVVQDVICHAL